MKTEKRRLMSLGLSETVVENCYIPENPQLIVYIPNPGRRFLHASKSLPIFPFMSLPFFSVISKCFRRDLNWIHKKCICQQLTVWWMEDSLTSHRLTRFLKAIKNLRPKVRSPVPLWDLALVHWKLMSAPFKPLAEVEVKWLTFKEFSSCHNLSQKTQGSPAVIR